MWWLKFTEQDHRCPTREGFPVGLMDLLAATEAFTKFEGHRLAELLADDVDLEDAQRIVLEQWQCMDEAGRRHWAAPSGAPTPIRRRAEGTAKRARRDVWRCLEVLEESSSEEISEELGAQRAFKRSSVVVGGKHPDWLTEPAAVAEISLPQLSEDDVVQVPREVVEKRLLSGPQLESVAYAARRFRTYLPSGVRAGYYLGDGTGCGKGRVIAALAWHLWNTGARRHLWLSAASDLQVDAARDFRDLGASLPLCKLSDMPYGLIGCKKGLDAQGNGIIFASYHLLVASKATASEHSPESSRLGQLIHWLREDPKGGLIALDEAHRAKNVAAGKASASKSGLAALELQRACPHCCVLYASATGASELRHLGYLERLGLWGPGRPHGSFEELMNAVEGGGLAAMELLAMTMRAEGMLSCRSLSFKGAAFRLVPVGLESLRESYERACDFWQSSLRVAKALLKERTQQVKRMRLKHSTELKENALHMRC